MRRIFLLLVIISTFLVFYGCTRDGGQLGSDALPDAVLSILGTYVVNGTDHLGNDYGGHLTITVGENPGEYELLWIIMESIQEGRGILEGNQLRVLWQSIDPSIEPYRGTVNYTVTVKGELYGLRIVDGKDGSGRETAYPNY